MQSALLDPDKDQEILNALKDVQYGGSNYTMILALKKALALIQQKLVSHDAQVMTVCVDVLVEILFIPNSSFMHKCYFSFVKSLNPPVMESVMEGWRLKISEKQDTQEFDLVDVVQSIMSMPGFESVISPLSQDILEHIYDMLLMVSDSLSSDGYKESLTDVCSRAATVGYKLVSGLAADIGATDRGRQTLIKSSILMIDLLEVCDACYLFVYVLFDLIFNEFNACREVI